MSIVLFTRFGSASTILHERIFGKKIVCTMPKETRIIQANEFRSETEVFNEPNYQKTNVNELVMFGEGWAGEHVKLQYERKKDVLENGGVIHNYYTSRSQVLGNDKEHLAVNREKCSRSTRNEINKKKTVCVNSRYVKRGWSVGVVQYNLRSLG